MNREAYQGWEEDRSRGSGEGEPERSGGEASPGGESSHPPLDPHSTFSQVENEESAAEPSEELESKHAQPFHGFAPRHTADEIDDVESDDDEGDASADGDEEGEPPLELAVELPPIPNLKARRRQRGYSKPAPKPQMPLSPQQKILLLDTWKRSGLPARDFGALVNISRHTLYAWKRAFEREGPAGLMPKPSSRSMRSRVSEITKRAIVMMKEANPEWGCQRISDMLVRGPALSASPNAVARVLREAGYEATMESTRRHPDKPRRFERARPNQMWQTDLFTFMLKRQNRRVHLVAFMDDHSRFITAYGLHASQSAALVIEVLRQGLSSYGAPQEILTDNGSQYVTWRGTSQFSKELQRRGIAHVVAKPRRPQTLGKIERFWGTLWRECIETAVFLDLEDARRRIGLFIDYYNLQRPHQGIRGMTPADRFFEAAPEVLKTLQSRVAANAAELARSGVPKQPFYLTGVADGQPFSVHREGDRVVLRRAGQEREEIDLAQPAKDDSVSEDLESNASPSNASLPEPLCPDGSPSTAWQIPPEEPGVGKANLDEDLPRLLEALRSAETDQEPVPSESDGSDLPPTEAEDQLLPEEGGASDEQDES